MLPADFGCDILILDSYSRFFKKAVSILAIGSNNLLNLFHGISVFISDDEIIIMMKVTRR
jgi:hypothetical protein